MRRIVMFSRLLVLAIFVATSGHAQTTGPSGLPLPRMVSLKFEEARLRTGPGRHYPVRWVYERMGWPVMVKAEFENWRQVVDVDGRKGWVHSRLLSSSRWAVVVDPEARMTHDTDPTSGLVATVEKRVMLQLHECEHIHCEVSVEGYRGWIERQSIWGLLTNELID